MKRWIHLIVGVLALALALFHLYAGGIQLFPATQQRAIHLGVGLALVFLLYPFIKEKKGSASEHVAEKTINLALAAVALVTCAYITVQYVQLTTSLIAPTTWTLIVGALVILLTLEASRRMLGLALPIIASIFLAYALWGDRLPLMLAHSGVSIERIITQVGLSTNGIFGTPLGVSASYVVLFVIFGAFLERSGAGGLFIDLAMALVGRFRGGAAKVSVVASSLFGSISGSQVANVVSTGVLTIPLMKKGGYKPQYAAAVESVASTGGMLLPPVMGAVAFLMADFLQISFAEVAFAALIPAILYYIAVFTMVDLRAAKVGLSAVEEVKTINVKQLLLTKGHLAIPLVLLVYLLMIAQLTTVKAVFWSILSVPIVCLIRKETRMSIKQISGALQDGVKMALVVIAACACAGIVIGVIDMTGIGLRFSGLLLELSGGNLLLLCILTMFASIVLGMGLPPVACYLILAILAAPAMTALGVSPIAAHLFIFYYGTLSAITPPVAIASYAAAGIAKANPLKVSLQSCSLGLVAFIIPFMFIFGPELILQGSPGMIVYATITAIVGVIGLSIAIEGFLFSKLAVASRILLFISSIMLVQTGMWIDIVGLVIAVVTLLIDQRNSKLPNTRQKAISDGADLGA
ncbi:TRAP transporter permease [Alkalihalobacillus deserti]|uniref:TRAP transporter permease n=1 Tax=Alkalihalobacillus deserti TaxID=2879466 RepID=UPI001D15A45A|nr:TRAP transporter permease [Alkalihalobacillus deserti]